MTKSALEYFFQLLYMVAINLLQVCYKPAANFLFVIVDITNAYFLNFVVLLQTCYKPPFLILRFHLSSRNRYHNLTNSSMVIFDDEGKIDLAPKRYLILHD